MPQQPAVQSGIPAQPPQFGIPAQPVQYGNPGQPAVQYGSPGQPVQLGGNPVQFGIPPQTYLQPAQFGMPGQVVPMARVPPALPVELWPHNFIILSAIMAATLGFLNLFTLALTIPAIIVGILVSIGLLLTPSFFTVKL